MNREDVIRMAREAGAIPIHQKPKDLALVGIENIERFAALVAAAEREACAALCERIWPGTDRSGHEWSDGFTDGTCDCAEAIRARKDNT